MKRKRIIKFGLLITSFFICLSSGIYLKNNSIETKADTIVYTYSFSTQTFRDNETLLLGMAEWTLSGDGSSWGHDSYKGQRFGSSETPYKSLTLSTPTFEDKLIQHFEFMISGDEGIEGSYEIKLGDNILGSRELSSSVINVQYINSSSYTGLLSIDVTQTSSSPIYIKMWALTYDGEIEPENDHYVTKEYNIKDYPSGTQFAVNEVHPLDYYNEGENIVTITTNECYFGSELIFYSGSPYNANAIIESNRDIYSLTINAGYNSDKINVYTSSTSTSADYTISVESNYADYTLSFVNPVRYIKFDVDGTNQIRVRKIDIRYKATTLEEYFDLFITKTDEVCGLLDISSDSFTKVWIYLKKEYSDFLTEENKNTLSIYYGENAMFRYDIIVKKYGLDDFLNRKINPASPNNDISHLINNNLFTIIVISAIGAFTLFVCLYNNKKRKTK